MPTITHPTAVPAVAPLERPFESRAGDVVAAAEAVVAAVPPASVALVDVEVAGRGK